MAGEFDEMLQYWEGQAPSEETEPIPDFTGEPRRAETSPQPQAVEGPQSIDDVLNLVTSSLQQTAGNPALAQSAAEGAADPQARRRFLQGTGAMAGGMAGTVAGAPTVGGALPAAVGGTMLGGAAGDYMADVTQSAIDLYRGERKQPKKGQLERAQDLAYNLTLDGALTAAPFAAPVLKSGAKRLFRRLMQVDNPSQVADVNRAASEFEVPIGLANISGTPRTLISVFGQMPFIGGGPRKALESQAKSIVAARQNLFGKIVNPAEDMATVSEEAFEAAKNNFDSFAETTQQSYQQALRIGREAGRVYPSKPIADVAQTAKQRLTRTVGTGPDAPAMHLPADVRRAIDAAANLGDQKLSLDDLMTLRNITEQTFANGQKLHNTQFHALAEINEAVDGVISQVAKSKPTAGLYGQTLDQGVKAKEASKLFEKNLARWHQGLKRFENSVGRTADRIENGAFKRGYTTPGARNPDEFLEMMRNINSPEKVRQLSKTSGPRSVLQLARYKIDDAWAKATGFQPGDELPDKLAFDGSAFRKALGMDNPRSNRYAAFREMLVNSGTDIREVERFTKLMESYGEIPLRDVSQFVTRAFTLRSAGGLGDALKGVVTLGGSAAAGSTAGGPLGGFVSAAATMGIIRHGLSSMIKPKSLRWINTTIDPNSPKWAKQVGFLHLMKMGMFGDPPEDIDETIGALSERGPTGAAL